VSFGKCGGNSINQLIGADRVKFPYATEEEMHEMEQALQNAINDIHSNAALKRVREIAPNVPSCFMDV
jgi:hypothetical protein